MKDAAKRGPFDSRESLSCCTALEDDARRVKRVFPHTSTGSRALERERGRESALQAG